MYAGAIFPLTAMYDISLEPEFYVLQGGGARILEKPPKIAKNRQTTLKKAGFQPFLLLITLNLRKTKVCKARVAEGHECLWLFLAVLGYFRLF